jgi:hypothetical protein
LDWQSFRIIKKCLIQQKTAGTYLNTLIYIGERFLYPKSNKDKRSYYE